MNDFRRLTPNELDRFDSDELVAYIREARDRGDNAALNAGFCVLVFRHERDVKARIGAKVPAADIDDVAQEALFSAMRNVIEGAEMRSFKAVLHTIVSRRIADYTDKRSRTLKGQPLAEEHADDETIWGEVLAEQDETEAVGTRQLTEIAIGELNPVHAGVIDLYVFGANPAQATADEINQRFDGHPDLTTPMTNDNVHKIAARFRERLRELLAEAEG